MENVVDLDIGTYMFIYMIYNVHDTCIYMPSNHHYTIYEMCGIQTSCREYTSARVWLNNIPSTLHDDDIDYGDGENDDDDDDIIETSSAGQRVTLNRI